MTNTERVRAALRKRQDEQAKREQGIAPAKPPAPARPTKPVPKPAAPKSEKPKQKPAKPPEPKPPRDPDKYRLPHGSEYRTIYDATKKQWVATLQIPRQEDEWGVGDFITFTETRSGVFHALHQLDRQYRRHLKAQAPKEGKKDDS